MNTGLDEIIEDTPDPRKWIGIVRGEDGKDRSLTAKDVDKLLHMIEHPEPYEDHEMN